MFTALLARATRYTVQLLNLEGRSSRWRSVRAAWLKDHPTCEACGGTDSIEIHHVMPVSFDPTLELVSSNFLVLCESPQRLCHLRIGHSFRWAARNPHAREDAAQSLARIKGRIEKK